MSTTEDRAHDMEMDRRSGGDYRCVTCDSGSCPPSGCEGRPGYVHTAFGWLAFSDAAKAAYGAPVRGSVDWHDIWSYGRFDLLPPRRVVFVDTETTGLDARRHQMVEVAWAEVEGPIHEARVRHSLLNADPKALEINRYWERGLHNSATWWRDEDALAEILTATFEGALLCSSNVDHDKRFIDAWLYDYEPHDDPPPWHHRPVEIGSFVAGALRLPVPASLHDTVERLRARGHTISEPDHTAAGDVRATRDCYLAVLDEAVRQCEEARR